MSELLDPIREQIIKEVEVLNGWTSLGRCLEMAQLVLEHRPNVIVELGTFGGKATLPMALALRHAGCGKIYTIDPHMAGPCLEGTNDEANNEWWKGLDLNAIHQEVINWIWRLGLEQIVIPIRARSQDVPELFPSICICSIDGNHSEEVSCQDVRNYVPRVKSGGLIFADDCDWPTTQKMQQIILESCDEIKSGENGHYKIFRKR